MAKRSRPQPSRRPPTAPPAPAPPAWRTRSFWLGAGAAAVLLVPAGVAAAVLAGGGDDRPAAPRSASVPYVERRAAELREEFAARDKAQVEELTARMRGLRDDLDPAVRGITARRRAGATTVAGWMREAEAAARTFEDVPSGETATNIARMASAAAVRGVLEAVRTYALARDAGAWRAVLLERARAEKAVALQAWETAIVQLDVVNIAAGFGHQHVGIPGTRGEASDGLPEGTDARP